MAWTISTLAILYEWKTSIQWFNIRLYCYQKYMMLILGAKVGLKRQSVSFVSDKASRQFAATWAQDLIN